MSETVPTGVQLTNLDKRFRENPYPVIEELREREPVHRDDELSRFVFTRHDDVARILKDLEMWSDPRKGNPGTFTREILGDFIDEPSMLLMDEPDHNRLRQLVRHSFTPRAIERWRPRVRQVTERIIGEVQAGEVDLMPEVAAPIPTVVIAELLGVDPEMHESFKAWSAASVTVAFSPVKDPVLVVEAEKAQAALDDFFRREIESRRNAPGEDLVSALVQAEVDGDKLSEKEIVTTCNLLLLAGNLTTTDLIGNGVKALLDHPEQMEKLRERPELMQNAVEEILRFDSPITDSGRIAHRDMEIGGVKIAQGETLSVLLAGANRDPSVYPDPDRFDIEREDTHHYSFGGGRHFCLGSHLSRLEAQETFATLLAHFPRLGHGEQGHEYASNPSFRGFKEFWIQAER